MELHHRCHLMHPQIYPMFCWSYIKREVQHHDLERNSDCKLTGELPSLLRIPLPPYKYAKLIFFIAGIAETSALYLTPGAPSSLA